MVSTVGILKRFYRICIPFSVRTSGPVSLVKQFIYKNILGHDAIYDSHYFESTVEGPAVDSAETISQSILNDLGPNTVVDVGCGTGALLEALRTRGCQVFGLEYSTAALQYCKERELDVQKFDLESENLVEDRTFDVAISMEVGEHLPEKTADRYVDLITRLSNVIVFTAATPGQGGDDHVNEQPHSYWISKFQSLGFAYDESLSIRWRNSWRGTDNVASFYHRNLMIFRGIPGNLV